MNDYEARLAGEMEDPAWWVTRAEGATWWMLPQALTAAERHALHSAWKEARGDVRRVLANCLVADSPGTHEAQNGSLLRAWIRAESGTDVEGEAAEVILRVIYGDE